MVFLTAKGGREDHLEGLESGAVAYLTKPFKPELLKIQIGNLIDQQMLIREKFRQDSPAVSVPADPFEAKVVEVLGGEFMNAEFGVKETAAASTTCRGSASASGSNSAFPRGSIKEPLNNYRACALPTS